MYDDSTGMRNPILVLTFLFLAGCSLVKDLTRPFQGKSDSVPVVAPAFSLRGPAAHLQDSLREKLDWIASQPPSVSLSIRRLAFRNGRDSTVELLATVEDSRRLNSHGLGGEAIRAVEAKRIGAERPMLANVRSAGIDRPFVVRARFTHRDYMFQNSKAREDSVDVLFPGESGSHEPD